MSLELCCFRPSFREIQAPELFEGPVFQSMSQAASSSVKRWEHCTTQLKQQTLKLSALESKCWNQKYVVGSYCISDIVDVAVRCMHCLHRPGKPISFFVKSKASTSCPSAHGVRPAEKASRYSYCNPQVPWWTNCVMNRVVWVIMSNCTNEQHDNACFLRAASFATSQERNTSTSDIRLQDTIWSKRRLDVLKDLCQVLCTTISHACIAQAPASDLCPRDQLWVPRIGQWRFWDVQTYHVHIMFVYHIML